VPDGGISETEVNSEGESAIAGTFDFIKSVIGICETKPLSHDLWRLEGNKVRVKLNFN
jgi:hypothetical protein